MTEGSRFDRRLALLIEGQRLFLQQGYTATTVDAVCDAAGVTKGAFFHHFASKDEFAREVLAFTWQPVADAHEEPPPAADPRRRLAQHIRFMAAWISDTGRLMPMMAQELGSVNPEIRQQVGGYFAMWMAYLEELLRAAAPVEDGAVDVGALKEFIVAATEGVPVAANQFGPQALANVSDHLVAAVMRAIGGSGNGE